MILKLLASALFAIFICSVSPALAANCRAAATAGNAPPDWQTYCWLDFSTYVDATARTAAGQAFFIGLTDGSTLTFTLNVSGPANPVINAIAAPSWTGSAVGNTAFIGIPGKPILYTANAGISIVTLSAIKLIPPPGAPAISSYSIVAADAESTDNAEGLQFLTNGGNWAVLDQVPPISGAQYPPITGTGTPTFAETGGGLSGNVGGYIVGSSNPTTVTTTLKAGGLQGAMFAVRFASIRLNKLILGSRAFPTDQFTFQIAASGNGTVFGSSTTTGTGNGPFNAAVVSFSSGLPLTLSEAMAAGSTGTLANYNSKITCTNDNSASTTTLPTNVATTSYSLGALAYGDALQCAFSNAAYPRLTLAKMLSGARVFDTDQFVMNIVNGATVLGTATTTGTGATIATGSTSSTQVAAGTAYGFLESASGSTNLNYYAQSMSCTNNAVGSTTVLPTTPSGTITPILGDVVNCTITNSAKAATATLTITKRSSIVSDPINGTTNPKAIPGAVIKYTITVTNTGTLPVDSSSVVVTDPLPSTITYYASSSAGPPVQFTNGTTASGLSFAYPSNVTHSTQASGGAPFTYTPIPDTNGYDAGVKGIRIAPAGTMAGATAAGQPSFAITFQARIN